MHAARMPERRAVRFAASSLCVSAGASGWLVAASSFSSRGTLALPSPVATFSRSGLASTVLS
jgi:hypothetical protein